MFKSNLSMLEIGMKKMTPVYKTTDALLSDYNCLPEIEQDRVGKYLKNLVRIHKALSLIHI